MKITCQEVQRDVTMRRCLARKDEIQRLQDHIEGLLQQLETHFITLDGKKLALEKVSLTCCIFTCFSLFLRGGLLNTFDFFCGSF